MLLFMCLFLFLCNQIVCSLKHKFSSSKSFSISGYLFDVNIAVVFGVIILVFYRHLNVIP